MTPDDLLHYLDLPADYVTPGQWADMHNSKYTTREHIMLNYLLVDAVQCYLSIPGSMRSMRYATAVPSHSSKNVKASIEAERWIFGNCEPLTPAHFTFDGVCEAL